MFEILAVIMYACAIFSIMYFLCYKAMRPNIDCPYCDVGKLNVAVPEFALKCSNCGAILER